MKNKRGTQSLAITALVVIMIVTFVIVVALMVSFSEGDVTSSSDRICTFSNQATGEGGAIYNALPQGAKPISGICITQLVTIQPDNFVNCDSSYRDLQLEDRLAALKNCAAQQVSNLLARCWSMNGEGLLDTGSRICFNTLIQSDASEVFSSKEEILEFAEDWVDSVYTELGLCQTNFMENGYSSARQCEASKALIENRIIRRLTTSALKDYYIDNSAGTIAGCLRGVDYDGDGLSDTDQNEQNIDGDEFLNENDFTPNGEIPQAEFVFNQIYFSTPNPATAQNIDAVLLQHADFDPTVGTCSQISTQLAEWLVTIREQDSSIRLSNAEIALSQPSTLDSDPFETQSTAIIPAYSLPDIGEIASGDLLKVMNEAVYPPTGKPYCETLPCSAGSPEFVDGFVIRPDQHFEVSFCDDIDVIGTGAGSDSCDRDKLKIAAVGSSIRGITSPYPEYCRFLDFEIGIFQDADIPDLGASCRSLACGIFGC